MTMMRIKSKRITLHERRAIVISDLHGNGHLLKRLLKLCSYTPHEDILILLGDLIEKGRDSLGTLHQVMELAKSPHVYVVMGNCDAIPVQVLHGYDIKGLCHYLQHAPWRDHTLLHEMADHLGLDTSFDDPSMLSSLVDAFHEEFAFLQNLPHVLESEHYLFAHAGILQEQHPYAKDAMQIMKNDRFALQAVHFSKTLICGHTPVVNYHEHMMSVNPLVDHERNIISIDGGCGVKMDGQLNALILQQGHDAHYRYVDDLPQAVITRDVQGINAYIQSINWFHNEVELLYRDEQSVLCRHLHSGVKLRMPQDCLYECDGQWYSRDFTNYRCTVNKGQCAGVIRTWQKEAYIKVDGIYGWIPKDALADA